MAKKKINITEAVITNINGTLFIEGIGKDGTVKLDLIDELNKFVGEDGKFNLKLSPFKEKKESNRQPTYKFTCSGCGKLIKSSEDEINVRCNDCDTDFQITD